MNSERKSCASSESGCDIDQQRKRRLRQLNDELRTTMRGGEVLLTRGVKALGMIAVCAIIPAVQQFDQFSADNDPHDEHDFGSFVYDGEQIIWKIDYYDLQFKSGSPDAADPDVTIRVLTIMLAEER